MAKFSGIIGFIENEENSDPDRPSVWEGKITEKKYRGDVIRLSRRLDPGQSINDNITISNQLSIVADAYANEHFFAIRYVKWMSALWEVKTVEVLRPRLILTLGGVYNGPSS